PEGHEKVKGGGAGNMGRLRAGGRRTGGPVRPAGRGTGSGGTLVGARGGPAQGRPGGQGRAGDFLAAEGPRQRRLPLVRIPHPVTDQEEQQEVVQGRGHFGSGRGDKGTDGLRGSGRAVAL